MRVGLAHSLVLLLVSPAACGSDPSSSPDAPGPDAPGPDASTVDAPGDPTAAELRAAIASCDTVVGGMFARDAGGTANISICGLPTAVFWTADLDVDCDGKMSTACNLSTDPSYQNQTAASDSMGNPLDAATLPYVVVPVKSTRFNYQSAGLALGSIVAVIYADQVAYGVIGDLGPSTVIGEASYRMAEVLGIDPDPSTGGTNADVAYVAFTGASAKVTTMEDQAEAQAIGLAHAKALLGR
ncbi:MAG: glycoside hydrolase family 75 protein [Proteobacteria bacterium]|nr:glycoside hydrolase family 75 protein [Pseudomonadota bacterium]